MKARQAMVERTADAMAQTIQAHGAADDADIARLRALSMQERSRLIESACESAAEVYRSRLAAGLPDVEPAPWPASTWEFLRKHAARVRA
jgi:hypothetical protein